MSKLKKFFRNYLEWLIDSGVDPYPIMYPCGIKTRDIKADHAENAENKK